MRKTLKCIICCLLCVAMVSLSVMAAEEPATSKMSLDWEGDYVNNKIVIKFKSTAEYIQQVMIVIYQGTDEIGNYKRIAEVTSTPGEAVTFDDFTMTGLNGDYTLKVSGNGYDWQKCEETATITIISDTNSQLTSINTADSTNIETRINDVKEALELDIPDDPLKSDIMTRFLNIRRTEYEGSFGSLNQVRDAYNKAYIIASLHNGASPSEIEDLVKKHSELLGLKAYVADEDYEANKSNIYANVVETKSSIDNCTKLVDAIKKFGAMEEINKATTETISDVMEKYHNDLGIPDDGEYWKKYTGFGYDSQRDSVLLQILTKRDEQLPDKKFKDPSVAKKAFEDGVKEVGNPGGSDLGGGSPSGPSGDDSFSVGNDGGGLSEKPNPVPTVKGFYDCNETHWAYTYVKDLYDLGFISGYADGSFLPDNSVTREEFVKMVIGAAGLYNANADCNFADVPASSWSYKYIASAYTNGIVVGNSAADFGAKSYITREDVCVISARILAKYGKQVDGESSFTDADSISDYAKDSVDALVELGIINGFEDGSFGAKRLLTRAQAAKIISLLRAAI